MASPLARLPLPRSSTCREIHRCSRSPRSRLWRFLQVNNILIIFFCLIWPTSRWVAHLVLCTVAFVLFIIVLVRSRLSESKQGDGVRAAHGGAHTSTDYKKYHPSVL